MLKGLNHITIAVSNLERSLYFYTHILGFSGHVKWDNGAYLSLGDLWFCLSTDKPCVKDDYTHIAFDIDDADFEIFCQYLKTKNIPEWKINKSEGKSIYIRDPDGHKLEIHVGNLNSRLKSLEKTSYSGLIWL